MSRSAPLVPTERLARERQRPSLFGAPVRQNNQNSQNEPGMSFVINEPCCARSAPDMVATGSPEPDRGRFGVNRGPVKHREKPTVGRAPTVATDGLQREAAGILAVCDERGRAVKALPYGALKEQAGTLAVCCFGEAE